MDRSQRLAWLALVAAVGGTFVATACALLYRMLERPWWPGQP